MRLVSLVMPAQIVQHEGVRGLYKGYLTSVAKAAPASAITFTVYKECSHLLSTIDVAR